MKNRKVTNTQAAGMHGDITTMVEGFTATERRMVRHLIVAIARRMTSAAITELKEVDFNLSFKAPLHQVCSYLNSYLYQLQHIVYGFFPRSNFSTLTRSGTYEWIWEQQPIKHHGPRICYGCNYDENQRLSYMSTLQQWYLMIEYVPLSAKIYSSCNVHDNHVKKE